MKANFLTSFLLLAVFYSFGQITYDKGYFIDNNNQRVECLIKNYDWKNNPDEIEFMTSDTSEKQTAGISSIKEFGINGSSRFVRADVKIDVSPMEMAKLSKKREPEWSQQRLFLKVLVEGKATLYCYTGRDLIRFFYSVNDTNIKQLIYKEYYADNDNVAFNSKFREQLWIDMRCENAKMNSLESMNFKKAVFEKYFRKYNECNGNISLVYGKRDKKEAFQLRLTPGINFSSISVSDNFYEIYNTKFKNLMNFCIGAEVQYILPFNRNKWSILFEPNFQHLYSEKELNTASVQIKYNSVEFPLGLRYYFFLNKDLSIFLNALYVTGFNLDLNSKILYDYPYASPLEIESKYCIGLGGGIAYKKLSAEFRYYTEREMLNDFHWVSKCNGLSVILGFKIF